MKISRRQLFKNIFGLSLAPLFSSLVPAGMDSVIVGGAVLFLNCFGANSEYLDLAIRVDGSVDRVTDVLVNGKPFETLPDGNLCHAKHTDKGTIVRLRLKYDEQIFQNGIPGVKFVGA